MKQVLFFLLRLFVAAFLLRCAAHKTHSWALILVLILFYLIHELQSAKMDYLFQLHKYREALMAETRKQLEEALKNDSKSDC